MLLFYMTYLYLHYRKNYINARGQLQQYMFRENPHLIGIKRSELSTEDFYRAIDKHIAQDQKKCKSFKTDFLRYIK